MPILEAESVIKQYKQYDVTVTAVDRVNLKVEDGEFIIRTSPEFTGIA
jgi:ABC-type sugar transport system ATPase subunit